MTTLRTALVQAASPPHETLPARVERVGDLVTSLSDVDLVVLPELWAPGYFAFDQYDRLAQPLDGPLITAVRTWAVDVGAYLQAGSFLERDASGRLHNTAVLIDPRGEVVLEYRKVHVFGYESREAQLLTPGEDVGVAATPFAGVGMSTCYDLRFPELYRALVDQGAELVIVPAAWPAARLDHWRLFTRARAVEDQVFLLACNAAGRQGETELAGHSVIVDPWGRVLAEAGTEEGVIRADLDLGAVAETRSEFPVLEDRRFGPSDRPADPGAGRQDPGRSDD